MIISGRQVVTMGQSGMAGMLSRSIYAARIHTMQKAICIGLVLKYGVMVNCSYLYTQTIPFFDFNARRIEPFFSNSMQLKI